MKVTMKVGVIVRNSRKGESKERHRRMDKLYASYKCPRGRGVWMCAGEGEESGHLRGGGRMAVGGRVGYSERMSRTKQQFVSYGEKTGWSVRRSPITCQIHARTAHIPRSI